jgi:limonene-1,2-epoxide hydrolase
LWRALPRLQQGRACSAFQALHQEKMLRNSHHGLWEQSACKVAARLVGVNGAAWARHVVRLTHGTHRLNVRASEVTGICRARTFWRKKVNSAVAQVGKVHKIAFQSLNAQRLRLNSHSVAGTYNRRPLVGIKSAYGRKMANYGRQLAPQGWHADLSQGSTSRFACPDHCFIQVNPV